MITSITTIHSTGPFDAAPLKEFSKKLILVFEENSGHLPKNCTFFWILAQCSVQLSLSYFNVLLELSKVLGRKLVIPKQVTWKGWKFTYDNWSWRCQAGKQDGFRIPFTPILWYQWRIFQSCFFQGIRRESVSWLASFIHFFKPDFVLKWSIKFL